MTKIEMLTRFDHSFVSIFFHCEIILTASIVLVYSSTGGVIRFGDRRMRHCTLDHFRIRTFGVVNRFRTIGVPGSIEPAVLMKYLRSRSIQTKAHMVVHRLSKRTISASCVGGNIRRKKSKRDIVENPAALFGINGSPSALRTAHCREYTGPLIEVWRLRTVYQSWPCTVVTRRSAVRNEGIVVVAVVVSAKTCAAADGSSCHGLIVSRSSEVSESLLS